MVTEYISAIEPKVALSEEINLPSEVYPQDTLSECVSVMQLGDLECII